jgi:hypothetical protein
MRSSHFTVARDPAARPWGTPAFLVIAGALAAAVGCGDPAAIRPGDVRRYDAPKTPVAQATRGVTSPAPSGGLTVQYEPPPGWTDRGASGMRLATLAIGDVKAGHEVTVIPAAGTLEANVTRWLGQLDPAAAEATLAERTTAALAAAETLDIDGVRGTIVLLPADAATADVAGEAILGAAIPIDDNASLFVKFKGPAEVARRERDNFGRFVSSIRWK